MIKTGCQTRLLFPVNCTLVGMASLLLDEMPHKNDMPRIAKVSEFVVGPLDIASYDSTMLRSDPVSRNETSGNLEFLSSPRVRLNCGILVRLLGTCARMNEVLTGKQLHCMAMKCGVCSNCVVGSAIVDLYSKCGFVREARVAFDSIFVKDSVSWNVMMYCYALNCQGGEGFSVFQMMRREGFRGDGFTFSSLLHSCSFLGSKELGKQIHTIVVKLSFDVDVFVATAIVNMYMKCADVKEARRAFDLMDNKNVASWNSLIVGYGINGQGIEAVKCFREMIRILWKPNELTLASVLSSCANLSAANLTTQVHASIFKQGFQSFKSIGNALINAYSKCGCILRAYQSFCSISKPDIVTWSSMISSYAFHGLAEEALDTFRRMVQEGVRPDGVAFAGVLSACSHAGLVDEGLHYFDSMKRNYKIEPGSEHYTCLVDLLGRCGQLVEAYNVILCMPFKPGANVLGALIGASKVHGNVGLAQWAAEKLYKLEATVPVNYLLMSNSYALLGCWEKVAMVRKMMRNSCGHKVPGCSWMEVDGNVHTFVSGDESHSQALEMYAVLGILVRMMKDEQHDIDFYLL